MGPIQVGFQVWGQYADWEHLMATGEAIDRLGFVALFANDHLMPVLGDGLVPVVGSPGPVMEGWQTIAGWAAVTHKVRLGVLVSAVGYRNIGLTVKMATTLDHASGGRMVLGLGAGWHEPEHRAFGFDYLTLPERIARLGEAAEVARRLLDRETVSFQGNWVTAHGAVNSPPPIQPRLPLLIGGSGEQRTLPIVARFADVWNGGGDPSTFRRKSAVLDRQCSLIGRESAAIRRSVALPPVCIRETRQRAVQVLTAALAQHGIAEAQAHQWALSSPVAAPPGTVIAMLRAYQAAGAVEALFEWPAPFDFETLERLAGPVRQRLD